MRTLRDRVIDHLEECDEFPCPMVEDIAEDLDNMYAAAREVGESWEEGDLAGAVTELLSLVPDEDQEEDNDEDSV